MSNAVKSILQEVTSIDESFPIEKYFLIVIGKDGKNFYRSTLDDDSETKIVEHGLCIVKNVIKNNTDGDLCFSGGPLLGDNA